MNNDVKVFGGIIGATILLIVGAVFFMGQGNEKPTLNGSTQGAAVVSQDILVREDSWSEGTPSAKVTVVEFGDFECPACKATEPITQEVRKNYQDKIRFVYRHFPLTQVHQLAFDASLAAEAAGIQGKFWQYHSKLFELSPNLQKDKLQSLAKDLGLDESKFLKDMDSDALRQRVLNDQADGNKASVNGTPTYFINGVRLLNRSNPNSLPRLEDFQAQIDPLLQK